MTGGPAPELRFRTLGEALAKASKDSGLTFIGRTEEERAFSFAELHERARRTAARLADLGVERGDRVAIALPTSPEFIDAFFGTLLCGATPVPLYPPLRLGRLEEYVARTTRMLQRVQPSLVLTDRRVRPLLGACVEVARPRLGCRTMDALEAMNCGEHAVEVSPDALALIQFSSGSTVEPKPVALTHQAILSNVAAIDGFLRSTGEPQRGVSWLPLYHDMGLIGAVLGAMYSSTPLALLPPDLFLARPALWLRALSRHQATVSPAPNFAFGLCLKRVRDEELQGVDLSRWSLALCGSEPVSPALMRAFSSRFGRFGFRAEALTPVYGLSEATLAVSFSQRGGGCRTAGVDPEVLARCGIARAGSRELVSVGTPLPGMEIQLRSETGRVLEEGRRGRVFVRGPSLMKGYFGDDLGTAAALQGGWLDTGDLGVVLEGELYLCGRAKDLVILRGANHHPLEFEECLDGLEGVRPGAVVAFGYVPRTGSEELGLLVETTLDAAPGLASRIRGRVAERTGIKPAAVELLEPGTLPRTSSGKLRRAEAVRRWLACELSPPERLSRAALAGAVAKGQLAFWKAWLRG